MTLFFPVRVERKEYQYLYKDDTGYSFMDNETFEQISVPETLVDAPQFLRDGQGVSVLINTETDTPMSVELPDKIVVKVTYSEPGVRGDTATRTLKPATVETGATVMVLLHRSNYLGYMLLFLLNRYFEIFLFN